MKTFRSKYADTFRANFALKHVFSGYLCGGSAINRFKRLDSRETTRPALIATV